MIYVYNVCMIYKSYTVTSFIISSSRKLNFSKYFSSLIFYYNLDYSLGLLLA